MSNIIVSSGKGGPIAVGIGNPDVIDIEVGTTGKPGKPGPPGPEGGTPVVAVPYASWPPANPVPGTLYLRLAP